MKMTATETGKTDVLVVGAGPTGLAMASELARRGVSCRIVEKAPAPTLQSRALGIQARTLELFENMGIVQEFTSLGWKSHAINLYAEGQRIAHISFDELDSPFPYLLFLPQSETERILTTHLANLDVRVERAVELTAFMQRGDRVQ